MNAYERMHPPGGYGLGRHGATPQPPAQSAQQLAEGSTGATTATPGASEPQGPQQRARQLLLQRQRPATSAAGPAAPPSLAAPPPAAQAPAPLAPPPTAAPVAPLAAPVAAPAPVAPAAPNQWGIDFSTPFTRDTRPAGWSDTMESIANPNAADPSGNRTWAADPRSNPNNTMSKFMVPSTHQEYYDFDNPAIQASPGGTLIGKDWASEWNPQAYAKPAPIVDSLPPPNQLPGYVNPANRGQR